MRQGRDLKLRNPIRGRKLLSHCWLLVNNLFEIKKPHKGTETRQGCTDKSGNGDLKLRNPIRGRKLIKQIAEKNEEVFEIKKPHKGTETFQGL